MRILLSNSWLLLLLVTALVAGCQGGPASSARWQERSEPNGGFELTEHARLDFATRSAFRDGVEAMSGGETERAVELFEALAGKPDAPTSAHINLAIALRGIDELDRARESLERALENNPKHPVARNELGITLRRLGQFDEAREQYEAALASHSSFHFARKNLAILCDLYLSDLSCALEHYRQYSQADPSDETVAIWIADLESRIQQGSE